MFLEKYIFALKFKFLGNKKNYVIYVWCFLHIRHKALCIKIIKY